MVLVQGQSKKVRCSDCGTPVAEMQGSVLLIKSKHHGEAHVTTIYLSQLDTQKKVSYGVAVEK